MRQNYVILRRIGDRIRWLADVSADSADDAIGLAARLYGVPADSLAAEQLDR